MFVIPVQSHSVYAFASCYGNPVKGITGLTNMLAEYSAIRGTDATGIAYCTKQICINKEGKSAYAMNFKVYEVCEDYSAGDHGSDCGAVRQEERRRLPVIRTS